LREQIGASILIGGTTQPASILIAPENLVTNKPAEPRFELRVDGQVSFKQSNPDGMVSG